MNIGRVTPAFQGKYGMQLLSPRHAQDVKTCFEYALRDECRGKCPGIRGNIAVEDSKVIIETEYEPFQQYDQHLINSGIAAAHYGSGLTNGARPLPLDNDTGIGNVLLESFEAQMKNRPHPAPEIIELSGYVGDLKN